MYAVSDRAIFFPGAATVLLYCVLALGFQPGTSIAAEPASAANSPATRFATVQRVRGEVTATSGSSGATRMLRENDAVFVGERLRAAGSAEAVLKTDEAGFIAIRPQAEFIAEQFTAEGKPTDRFTLRLIKGGVRMITGWIGRINRTQYRVTTLTATIGIRGTDHEPYEMSDDLASALAQDEGTYDKVNRGGTTMDVSGRTLAIDSGKVGFANRPPKPGVKRRGLLTITLPVLLDKVPNFYVPGQFDDELDRLSLTADEDALRELNARRKGSPERAPAPKTEPTAKPTPQPPVTAPKPPAPTPAAPVAGDCVPATIARTWLSEFDAAIVRRDVQTILQKFAPDVSVRVTVRDAKGKPSTVEMGRDELARSTIAAVRGLTDYQQRRPSIEGRLAEGGVGTCDHIGVKSVVIEQGRQNGKPYRFESIEEYVLVRRNGLWLAITAEATQR